MCSNISTVAIRWNWSGALEVFMSAVIVSTDGVHQAAALGGAPADEFPLRGPASWRPPGSGRTLGRPVKEPQRAPRSAPACPASAAPLRARRDQGQRGLASRSQVAAGSPVAGLLEPRAEDPLERRPGVPRVLDVGVVRVEGHGAQRIDSTFQHPARTPVLPEKKVAELIFRARLASASPRSSWRAAPPRAWH